MGRKGKRSKRRQRKQRNQAKRMQEESRQGYESAPEQDLSDAEIEIASDPMPTKKDDGNENKKEETRREYEPIRRRQEPDKELESEIKTMSERPRVSGECKPKDLQEKSEIEVESESESDDAIAFTLNWMMSFLITSSFAWVLTSVVFTGFFRREYNDVLWIFYFAEFVGFIFLIGSAWLALKAKLDVFWKFIFAWWTIFCTSIMAIFTVISIFKPLELRSNVVNFEQTFWKMSSCLCSIWLVCVAWIPITWVSIGDRQTLKINLHGFVKFVKRYAISLYIPLFFIAVIAHFYDYFYEVSVDETLEKLCRSLCGISIIAFFSFFLTLSGIFDVRQYSKGGITFEQFKKL